MSDWAGAELPRARGFDCGGAKNSTRAAEELLMLKPDERRELAQQTVRERWDHPQAWLAVRVFRIETGQPLSKLADQLRAGLRAICPGHTVKLSATT